MLTFSNLFYPSECLTLTYFFIYLSIYFPKIRNYLNSHSKIIKIREFILKEYYYVISSSWSNFNCFNNIFYSKNKNKIMYCILAVKSLWSPLIPLIWNSIWRKWASYFLECPFVWVCLMFFYLWLDPVMSFGNVAEFFSVKEAHAIS